MTDETDVEQRVQERLRWLSEIMVNMLSIEPQLFFLISRKEGEVRFLQVVNEIDAYMGKEMVRINECREMGMPANLADPVTFANVLWPLDRIQAFFSHLPAAEPKVHRAFLAKLVVIYARAASATVKQREGDRG